MSDCIGIATAWSRYAHNTNEYLALLKDNHIFISSITQEKEGEIAFKAANNVVKNENNPVFFDLGGGSYQISKANRDGNSNQIHVIKGLYGCINFKYELEDFLLEEGSAEFNDRFLNKSEVEKAKKFIRNNISDSIACDEDIYCEDGFPLYGLGANAIIQKFCNDTKISKETIGLLINDFSILATFARCQQEYIDIPSHFIKDAQYLMLLADGVMEGVGTDELVFINPNLSSSIIAELSTNLDYSSIVTLSSIF